MCWTSKEKPILRIAPRNIPVYKVLRRPSTRTKYLYPYHRWEAEPYQLKRLYWADKLDEPIFLSSSFYTAAMSFERDCYRIEHGIHSIRKRCVKREYNPINNQDSYMYKNPIDEKRMIFLRKYKTSKLCLCHIPKGAKYYLNGTEYVSDRIIVDEIMND